MSDTRTLLERHVPRLAYDAQEAYFADSAAVWTDSPANVLKRAGGTPIAAPPTLSLDFLGPHAYGDGTRVLAGDTIGDATRDYARNAAALHAQPRYRDRVYGHARADRNGRLWLQYWLFYYYNDYRLLGALLSGGKHEGDWELVQVRLGPSGQPEQAVYGQHRTAESRAWAGVRTYGAHQPIVYVARGSHANYFNRGTHWTGHWFDQADGRGPQITPTLEIVEDKQPAWLHWPGAWGDTKATRSPFDSNSPISPGRRPHWMDPLRLSGATPRTAPAPLPPPRATIRRAEDHVVVAYEADPRAAALVVATRPKGSNEPARTHAFPLDHAASGEVEIPVRSDEDEMWTSVVASDVGPSEAVRLRGPRRSPAA